MNLWNDEEPVEMSNFGATFRKTREAKGLPLEKIAAETRISTRFLTAIENEAFQSLPGGIFNRGFIRAYADYLGLDSNQVVADYDRLSSTAQEPTDILRDTERGPARNSDWNVYLVAAAILLALMVAYYFVTRTPTASTGPLPQRAAVVPPPPQPAQPQTEAPVPLSATPASLEVPKLPPPPSPPAQAVTSSTPAPAAAPAVPTHAPPPAVPSPSALAVDVNVTDSTWMKVTADGTVALSEVLQAGTNRRFSAERSIDVVIGNAAGATMQINGRDLGQLGTSGRVREFKITPENAAQIR
jgi:cytoskeleton protein RodZ